MDCNGLVTYMYNFDSTEWPLTSPATKHYQLQVICSYRAWHFDTGKMNLQILICEHF